MALHLHRIFRALALLTPLVLLSCGAPIASQNQAARAPLASPSAPQTYVEPMPVDVSQFPAPPARPAGAVTISLLLPMSDSRENIRALAEDLFNAAQLAVFDAGQSKIVLRLHDTQGTPEGAARAAKEAIAAEADILIGPLFSSSAKAVAPVLAGRTVSALAFSNDRSVRADNIWLLGFMPEQNIDRVVVETISQGLVRFGVLVPEGAYGDLLLQQVRQRIERFGGELVQAEAYPEDAKGMFDPVRRLAQFDRRKQAHTDELARLTAEARRLAPADTPDDKLFSVLRTIAPELVSAYEGLKRSETLGEIPYDVVFVPEGGLALRKLAPLLPYFDIDPKLVKFIGTGLWDDPSLSQEPPLHGGWYAAPDRALWAGYQKRYEQLFARPAPRLTSIAYDSVSLAIKLATINQQQPFSYDLLTDPNGFAGLDGIVRLTAEGLNDRGLAVQEITARAPRIVSPAPRSFVEHDRRLRAALALADSLQGNAAAPLTDLGRQ